MGEQVPTSLQDADQAKATEAPESIEKLATRTEQEVPLQTGAKKKKTKGKQTKKPIEEDVDQAKTVRAPEVDQAKKVHAPEVENSVGITTSDQQAPMQIDAKNTLANPKRTAKQTLTPAARNMQLDAKNTLANPERTAKQPLTTAVGKKKARLEEQVPTSLQDADQAKATEAP